MRRSPSILSLAAGALLAVGLPSLGLCQTAETPVWLLVADVSCQPEDAAAGSAISDALREGLTGFEGIRVVMPGELGRVVEAMGLPEDAELTGSIGYQVAVRAGIPLMVEADLVADGSAYDLEVRVMDPENGTVHLRTPETASSEAELAEAAGRALASLIDDLGDVVPTVTNRPRLSLVFTRSLDALKLHTRAAAANQRSQPAESLPLLEEAVQIDPDFAAGWRLLGVVLSNLGQDPDRQVEALTRAYELSHDLPDYERLTTEASYYQGIYDNQGSVAVYEELAERYPDRGPWNNLGLMYATIGEYEKSRDAHQKAVSQSHSSLSTGNLIAAAVRIGDLETARETLKIREDEGVGTPTSNMNYAATIAYLSGDREEARRLDLAGAEAATTGPARATDLRLAGYLDAGEGRVDTFRQRFQEANQLWSEAGSSLTVFRNRAFLVLFDALVLGQNQDARARLSEALEEAAAVEAPLDPFDAGNLAFFGMSDRARAIAGEWEENTSAGLQAQYGPQLHRLSGFLAMAEGRTEEGLRELEGAVAAGFESPFNLGELALAYDRAGMPDLALEAFHRYLDAPNVNRAVADGLFLGLTYERLGQLHEARGETEEAVKFHTLFVELWAEADSELQPRVEAARAALARLTLVGVAASGLR